MYSLTQMIFFDNQIIIYYVSIFIQQKLDPAGALLILTNFFSDRTPFFIFSHFQEIENDRMYLQLCHFRLWPRNTEYLSHYLLTLTPSHIQQNKKLLHFLKYMLHQCYQWTGLKIFQTLHFNYWSSTDNPTLKI